MACAPLPADDRTLPSPEVRPMTRCECSGVSFEEAAQHLEAQRIDLEELARRTGCGGNCTACLPDFRRFLLARVR